MTVSKIGFNKATGKRRGKYEVIINIYVVLINHNLAPFSHERKSDDREVRNVIKRIFWNRKQAGERLAVRLKGYADRDDVLILALPRGGVPIGFEIARHLHAPLDVFTVRKLGTPGQEELAMGAIAPGGIRELNQDIVDALMISDRDIERIVKQEQAELERREKAYRGDRPRPEIRDKIVILVDDGLATGASMRAAVHALRQMSPAKITVAVPVGAVDTCSDFRKLADEIICLATPEPFYGVGAWYEDFSQTSDEEVRELLDMANEMVKPVGNKT
jgi:putative phosphoribosyl transferase